ncbi:unnamed protein product [Blepharisma stoltei]|uniref:F-box domain-containing protein n=1 Tax=Blepharisma stoltei TaxID=1481888 RepID=A0AAU9K846_9CILI|nr:unnamed protein product [Blepharisma stoltei]
MNVFKNLNLLGNILSFLNPFELFTSILLVNKSFNYASKSYWEIEKILSNMLSDIFWLPRPIENPGIHIFAGLIKHKNKRVRSMIKNLSMCNDCGRFLKKLGPNSYDIFVRPATEEEKIKLGGVNLDKIFYEKHRLIAFNKCFYLHILSNHYHKYNNIRNEDHPITLESPDPSEWYIISRYWFEFVADIGTMNLISDFKNSDEEWAYEKYLNFELIIGSCNRNSSTRQQKARIYLTSQRDAFYLVSSYQHVYFYIDRNLLELFKQSCHGICEKFSDLFWFKSRKRIAFMVLDIVKHLILANSAVIYCREAKINHLT